MIRIAFIGGLGLFLVWILAVGIRSVLFFRQTQILESTADRYAREYYLGNPAQPLRTYLVAGDSTAAGVGTASVQETYPYKLAESLAARGYRVHVINRAQSGARARDIANGQLKDLEKIRPDYLTITVGANDAIHLTPSASYRQSLTAIADRIRATETTVLVAETPDTGFMPALPFPLNLLTRQYAVRQNNDSARILAGSRAVRVPLFKEALLDYSVDSRLYAPDHFHPSPTGYSVWATVFIASLPSANQ